jgi:hypothetical protein
MPANVFEIISNEQVNKITTNQAEVLAIVKDEKERLFLKKGNMDAEANNAERMLLLNQTHRDRQHQYLVVMVLFLIVFGICLGIVVLQKKFGYSSIFMDVLIVLVIGSGMVTAFFMVSNIITRDPIDFTKVDQNGGNLIDVSKLVASTDAAAIAAAAATSSASACKGSDCCGPSNKWDPSLMRCTK